MPIPGYWLYRDKLQKVFKECNNQRLTVCNSNSVKVEEKRREMPVNWPSILSDMLL